MRTVIILLTSILMFTSSMITDSGDSVNIDIKRNTDNTAKPRSSELSHIVGRYEGFDRTIYLDFRYDIGNISVSVINLMTGEMVYANEDSASGIVRIGISGTSGQYVMTIQSESGDTYTGEFAVR